jgi:alkylhydroperoxidase/carboxymuconolactone decarboxylase family protein YurZ
MNKAKQARVRKLNAFKLKKMKGAETAPDMIKSWGFAFEGDKGDPGHNEYAKTSIFAKKIPDLIADYGSNPHIHLMERGKLHPKIKALIHIAIYCINGHSAVAHWAVAARQWGATDDEILEAAAVATIAYSKSKMVDIDHIMTGVFNNPDFVKAKNMTKRKKNNRVRAVLRDKLSDVLGE